MEHNDRIALIGQVLQYVDEIPKGTRFQFSISHRMDGRYEVTSSVENLVPKVTQAPKRQKITRQDATVTEPAATQAAESSSSSSSSD